MALRNMAAPPHLQSNILLVSQRLRGRLQLRLQACSSSRSCFSHGQTACLRAILWRRRSGDMAPASLPCVLLWTRVFTNGGKCQCCLFYPCDRHGATMVVDRVYSLFGVGPSHQKVASPPHMPVQRRVGRYPYSSAKYEDLYCTVA
jgi:hypothetical protein